MQGTRRGLFGEPLLFGYGLETLAETPDHAIERLSVLCWCDREKMAEENNSFAIVIGSLVRHFHFFRDSARSTKTHRVGEDLLVDVSNGTAASHVGVLIGRENDVPSGQQFLLRLSSSFDDAEQRAVCLR